MDDSKQTLSVIIAGHPKLSNDLKRPSMEEVGARSQVFSMNSLIDSKIHYIDWLLKQCCKKEVKTQEIITPEALALLADRLITPLQINYYLTHAFEKAYLAGVKPITVDIIESILVPEINDIEARLARHGYNLGQLCGLLNAKPNDVKSYLNGTLNPAKAHEFSNEIKKLDLT